MVLKFFNTLTRKVETFKPIKEGEVRMYSCGPTVYNFPHIGNYRAYIAADLLRRYLEYNNYKVKQIMNITDVDDKTIRDSQEQKVSLKEFTEKYIKAFFEDIESLNIKKAFSFPKATEHIEDMTTLIKKLLDKGIAYKGEDGSIYYAVSKFKDYGKLAHIKLEDLKSGARVKQDEYEKEQANDFALWKAYDKEDGDVFWETEIGKGRPGWHIECSAMSMKHLGNHFDIHTGGIDLIFPHHENEIAQSEAATGEKFVNYWIHNEWLLVEGKKMSKSLGNFFTLRDLIKKNYNPKAIRYLLLSTHYKQQLNFTFKGLEAADAAVKKLNDFVSSVKNIKDNVPFNERIPKICDNAKLDFEASLDDDLNISSALASIFDMMKEINILISENKVSKDNKEDILKLMDMFDSVIGVIEKDELIITEEIKNLVDQREKARIDKDWKKADELRNQLDNLGTIVEDSPGGPVCKKKRSTS